MLGQTNGSEEETGGQGGDPGVQVIDNTQHLDSGGKESCVRKGDGARIIN